MGCVDGCLCNLPYACDGCPYNAEVECPWCGGRHTGQCDEMVEYRYRDDTWPSRMWNREGDDYTDLSGRHPDVGRSGVLRGFLTHMLAGVVGALTYALLRGCL